VAQTYLPAQAASPFGWAGMPNGVDSIAGSLDLILTYATYAEDRQTSQTMSPSTMAHRTEAVWRTYRIRVVSATASIARHRNPCAGCRRKVLSGVSVLLIARHDLKICGILPL
jgi:hypothetical protein